MTFRSRNAYYLRMSSTTTLPLYLYLDGRHIDWMSDRVLQHVLADLRPLIVPKLQAERDTHFGPGAASGKNGTVEVHRGDFYQFAYFFRKIESHSIVTKTRHFVAAPPRQVLPASGVAANRGRSNKKRRDNGPMNDNRNSYKRQKTINGSEELTSSIEDSNVSQAHRKRVEEQQSKRPNRVTSGMPDEYENDTFGTSNDVDIHGSPESGSAQERTLSYGDGIATSPTEDDTEIQEMEPPGLDLDVEMEEEKPKPLLKLKYQALTVSGHCLCVVVEPWSSPQHPIARLKSAPPVPSKKLGSFRDENLGPRGQTPLFLPEFDETVDQGHRDSTPIAVGTPLLRFDDVSGQANNGFDNDTLMNFSQALNTAGHTVAISDDDDDMDGAVLFGDADEIREFS